MSSVQKMQFSFKIVLPITSTQRITWKTLYFCTWSAKANYRELTRTTPDILEEQLTAIYIYSGFQINKVISQ